jgi:serine/threonine-protein kinase RsbW
MRSIAFPGRFSSLSEIRKFYAQAAEEAALDEKSICEVELAVDEAASNIIDHAYEGEGKGDIECSYEIEPGRLEVIMRDHGKAFDPEKVKAPNIRNNPRRRKQRGLGLHFMKSLMDSVEFSFSSKNGNELRMVKIGKTLTDQEHTQQE